MACFSGCIESVILLKSICDIFCYMLNIIANSWAEKFVGSLFNIVTFEGDTTYSTICL